MSTTTQSGQSTETVEYTAFVAALREFADGTHPREIRDAVEAWADAHDLRDRPDLSVLLLWEAENTPTKHVGNSLDTSDPDPSAALAALAIDAVVADCLQG